MAEDIKQCCNLLPCPYHGHDAKTCEECNCYREVCWDEDEIQTESEVQE